MGQNLLSSLLKDSWPPSSLAVEDKKGAVQKDGRGSDEVWDKWGSCLVVK